MQEPNSVLVDLYRVQIAGMRQMAAVALAGLERVEHLYFQSLREATRNPFQVAEAETVQDDVLLPDGPEATALRLTGLQRELTATVGATGGALLAACEECVRRMVATLVDASAENVAEQPAAVPDPFSASLVLIGEPLSQWQALTQRFIEASNLMSAAAPDDGVRQGGRRRAVRESSGEAPTARTSRRRRSTPHPGSARRHRNTGTRPARQAARS